VGRLGELTVRTRRRRIDSAYLAAFLPLLSDPALQQHVSELSDQPDAAQSERVLRDVCEKGDVKLLNGVGLKLGCVADESDEGGRDLFSNKVSSLTQEDGISD
jgi:hypothetical protein